MKKIYTDYAPAKSYTALVIIVIVATMFTFMGLPFAFQNKTAFGIVILLTGAALFALSIVLALCIDFGQTEVGYGEGSIIKCKWMFHKWEIDISKAEYVIYRIEPHWTRGGTINTFNVEFGFESDGIVMRKRLRAKLNTEQIAGCIAGSKDNIPLMQLYRYVEENYPKKAKGQEKY